MRAGDRGGRRIAILSALLAGAVAAALVFIEREEILARWYERGLHSSDPEVREAALAKLEELGSTRAIPELLRELYPPFFAGSPPSPAEVCRGRLESLLRRRGAAAISALATALAHSDPVIRKSAAKFLGDVGPEAEEAVTGLAPCLKDPDQELRREAASAIIEISREDHPAFSAAKAIEDTWEAPEITFIARWEIYYERSREIPLPAILKLLDKSDEHSLQEALRAILRLGPAGKEALPKLERLFARPGMDLWVWTACATAQLDPARRGMLLGEVLGWLKTDDWRTKLNGVVALGEMSGVPEAQEAAVHYTRKWTTENHGALARDALGLEDLQVKFALDLIDTDAILASLDCEDPYQKLTAISDLELLAPQITPQAQRRAVAKLREISLHAHQRDLRRQARQTLQAIEAQANR